MRSSIYFSQRRATLPFLSKSSLSAAPNESSPISLGLWHTATPCHCFWTINTTLTPDSDIRLFLTSSFAEIRRRYHIPLPWPSSEDVEQLVWRASGQFIYVATIIRFVQGRSGTPQSQLDSILNLCSTDHDPQAFADLDALYTHIMMLSPNPHLSGAWVMLVTDHWNNFVGSKGPPSALFCRQVMESVPGEADHLLGDLGSLLFIPRHGDQDSPYTLFHASLRDFMYSEIRCPPQIFINLDSNLLFTCERIRMEAFQRVFIRESFILQFITIVSLQTDRRPPVHDLSPEELAVFLDKFLEHCVIEQDMLIAHCDVL